MVGGGVGVNHKIALLQELVVIFLRNAVLNDWRVHLFRQRTFHLDGFDFKTVWIEQIAEIALFGRWVLYGKQTVVEACLGIDTTLALHPVDSRFGLAVATLGADLEFGS